MNGLLIIDKPRGITSRDVVNKVTKKLGIKKIGHTGTLDPIATGVLVLCVGKATKLVELLTCDEKEYIATVTLGVRTDTLDITGKIIEAKDEIVSKEMVINTLNKFKGKYNQVVPLYSAVKVNGKKLYEYAIDRIDIDLPKREVEIKKIELVSFNNNKFTFKCLVSKGAYIRSLIRDICFEMGVIGSMSDLIRTKQGKFSIDDCISIDEVNQDKLVDIKNVLDIPSYDVDEFLMNKIKCGQILDNRYQSLKVQFIYNNKLIAIYQIYEKDKTKIKPYRIFM